MKAVFKKLNDRDIRALKITAVAVPAILLLVFAMNWFEHWVEVKKSIAQKQTLLNSISPSKAKLEGLRTIVPVFQMPQEEEKQKLIFRDKFQQQIKKVGIKCKPLQILSGTKSGGGNDYKLLRLRCIAEKCKFGQVVDLLADLKQNPCLVGIEAMKITCDPKKRSEFELDLTVSTFVR